MKRTALALCLLVVLVAPIMLFIQTNSIIPNAKAQTQVNGIITQDTTWTKANSPYALTGNLLVNTGVTLTIQAGVTLNLNSYYIRVNGTLAARGTSSEKIYINGGSIEYTSSSIGWNEETGSGCLIENAVITQTSISSSNPMKIDNSIINGAVSVTSSIVTNNIIKSDLNSRSSVVTNNNVDANIVLGNFNPQALSAPDTSTVSNNIIDGSITAISSNGTPQIFNNTISNGGIGCSGYSHIYNNYIHGCNVGISLYTPRVFGGNLPCYATVENNLVVDNSKGIAIDLTEVFGGGTQCPTIRNNTISGNLIGISLSELGYNATPTIQNNNLQNNSNYNFYLAAPNNVNVAYNWWGTTNQSTISTSIYDFKNDFNLGTVNFTPFLSTPESQAPTIPTQVPIPEFSSWTILLLLTIMTAIAGLSVYFKKRKR
jgi:hypothetical protein